MEYKCRLERLEKIKTSSKEDLSLCTNCASFDCSNPIENVSISIFGIMHNIRAYVTPNSVYVVKSCDGYSLSSIGDEEDDGVDDGE